MKFYKLVALSWDDTASSGTFCCNAVIRRSSYHETSAGVLFTLKEKKEKHSCVVLDGWFKARSRLGQTLPFLSVKAMQLLSSH